MAKEGFENNNKNRFCPNGSNCYSGVDGYIEHLAMYLAKGDPGNIMLAASFATGPAYAYSYGDDVSNVVGLQKRNGEFYDLCNQMLISGSASQYETKKDVVCDIYRYIFGNVITDTEEHNGDTWIQSGTEAKDGIWLHFGTIDAEQLGIKGLNVSTQSGALNALDMTKEAQSYLASIRSEIGAQQNRLEHTIANENNVIENTTAAESRVRDTDMSKEIVQNSMQDILSQAGISMMSQANQSNQGVLSLLQ